mgnify:CR=1 FL=1
MKKRTLNIFIFSLLILMAFNLISATSYSFEYKLAPENSELNWYFVNRGNDQIPECPKESAEFLDTYDAYYVGDTENKIIYLTFDEGYENGYTVKILDILKEENVKVDKILGHGGLFKTKGVGQSILAAAMDTPVTVMETAGEGGAWGIAVLASYMKNKAEGETLDAYLDNRVFAGQQGETLAPKAEDVAGFDAFMERYGKGLAMERAAVDSMR